MTDRQTSPVVTFYDDADDIVTIRTGDNWVYDIVYDEYTGDWLIACDEDDRVKPRWFTDKDGAIQYTLKLTGVIEEATYTIVEGE